MRGFGILWRDSLLLKCHAELILIFEAGGETAGDIGWP
jgi:hypothetical protein